MSGKPWETMTWQEIRRAERDHRDELLAADEAASWLFLKQLRDDEQQRADDPSTHGEGDGPQTSKRRRKQ